MSLLWYPWLLVLLPSVYAAVGPSHYPATGIQLTTTSPKDAAIKIDIFLEVFCKDSRDGYPVLMEWLGSRGTSDVSVTLYLFPLPYHTHSVLATQVLFLLRNRSSRDAILFLEALYQDRMYYSDKWHRDIDGVGALSYLAETASNTTGIDADDVRANVSDYRKPVVMEWKYSCRRRVAGTPWHFINGQELDLSMQARPLTAAEWTSAVENAQSKTTQDQVGVRCSGTRITVSCSWLWMLFLSLLVATHIRMPPTGTSEM